MCLVDLMKRRGGMPPERAHVRIGKPAVDYRASAHAHLGHEIVQRLPGVVLVHAQAVLHSHLVTRQTAYC